MKRLLPFVVTMLALLFPALASAQEEQKGKITIEPVEHCVLTVTYINSSLETVTVNSGDMVQLEKMITITSVIDDGYELECYVVNDQDLKPFANRTAMVTVNGDLVIKARVKKSELVTITIEQPEHGAITVRDQSNESVEVKSGEQVMTSHELSIEVVPETGYEISHWLINDVEKSVGFFSPNMTNEVVTKPLKISAVMKKLPAPSTLTLVVEPAEGGSLLAREGSLFGSEIEDLTKIKTGSVVYIEFTPTDGYTLKNWVVDGEEKPVSSGGLFGDNSINVKVSKDMTVKAILNIPAAPEGFCRITLQTEGEGTLTATDAEGKAVNSGDVVKKDANLTFTATPAEGYEVDEWKVNGTTDTEAGKETVITKQITADTKVTVSFKKKPEPVKEFAITVNAVDPAEAGTLTVTDDKGNEVKTGAKVAEGTKLTVTAEANGKYNFKNFTINTKDLDPKTEGVTKVTDKKYTYEFEVKENTEISATFSKPTSADDILAQTKEFAVVDGSIYCPGARMIALYTMDGALVRTIEAEVMEVRDLAAGNYLVIATNREGVALQKKIVL